MLVELSENSLREMIINLPIDNMIILKFTAEWCVPCKGIQPICDKYKNIISKNIIYLEIDIDESIEVFVKLKKCKMLNGVPALLAYKGGERDVWYVPDDSVLGGDKEEVIKFFERCMTIIP